MAGMKSGGVIDWQWLAREMPISGDALSRRARHVLFEKMDLDNNGLLHRREAIMGLLKSIRVVRGILDLRPVWTVCFRLARSAVDPVVPIGIDFMDQNQFRMYLVSVWLYLRLWEHCYCDHHNHDGRVTAHDLPEVSEILENFGYSDPQRFDTFARPYFQNLSSELTFSKFVELCLEHVLPELSGIDDDYERNNAIEQIGKLHPALLRKADEVGSYKAHSLETGQARMTGFIHKQMRKAASDSSVLMAPMGNTGQQPRTSQQRWTSQYAMQFTTTKFLPQARRDPVKHPCHTERDLPISHPYYQILNSRSPSGPPLQPDIGRVAFPSLRRAEASKPLKAAGYTMAQKLHRLGVIPARP